MAGLGLLLGGCVGVGKPAVRVPAGASLGPGDLVFLDLGCGAACDAVARVTAEQLGVSGPALSHVAMIVEGGSRPSVIEAWPRDGVVERPLAEILSRVAAGEGQPGGFWVARLRPERRALGAAAAEVARRWRNLPYDHLFLPEEGRLYCAELVFRAYQSAAPGESLPFKWAPMSFGKPGTPERATWERYYRGLGHEVPDGVPGVSPLGIWLQGQPLFEAPAGPPP
jgi:hypothetical protein